MRFRKLGLPVVISLVASATVAFAAGIARPVYKPAPPPVVVSDWTGFYVGAHAGWGWGDDPFTLNSFAFSPSAPFTDTGPKSDGFVAGFQAGYNQQWNSWVSGLEIDLSGTDIKGSTTFNGIATGVPCGGGLCTVAQNRVVQDKFEMLGTVRARVGFLAIPNLLFYGTGGLAWTSFDQRKTTSATESGFVSTFVNTDTSTSSWRFGWAAGGGAEAKLFDSNWLARVEYLHYDFGDSGSFSNVQTTASSNFTSGHLTVDVVRAGLSYKFGGGPAYAR